ncbi:hypothetical protein D1007_59958 [Hordeum vulgare]|nr:hypothetical protein D1007_59958 [Hordeum vulgare]
MCAEPTSLAVLMAKADKYATADSAMRIKVTTADKVVPAPATPMPAGDNRGGQNNYKRKADQMANNKLVANVEGEASASQAGPPRKRRNQGNPNWLPKQTLEQLLDAPCKIHSGAVPSTHTLRHIAACGSSRGRCAISPVAAPGSTDPGVGIRPTAGGGCRFRSLGRLLGAAIDVVGLKAMQILSDYVAALAPLQDEVIPGDVLADGTGSHPELLLHSL